MTPTVAELLPPKVLLVDDERQIHASLRLRIGRDYQLICCFDAGEALAKLATEQFDLCFTDVHMPNMDGLRFIEAAQQRDPSLGYVILSAFDTDANLRRSIPLPVYDFIPKPLPDRQGFEHRIPEWVDRTRSRRREHALAQQAGAIEQHLDSARLERDVEIVASETARDALHQTASLLTTIHAHLVTATTALSARARNDSTLNQLVRNLDEARKTADAAVAVTGQFFDSSYANRDSSPALVETGLRNAVTIASRIGRSEASNKRIDVAGFDDRLPVRGLSGIDFLLMLVPALGAALAHADANSTVRIEGEPVARLDSPTKDPRYRFCLWLNRRNALSSQPGIVLAVTAAAPALTRAQADAWLKGENLIHGAVSSHGLLTGIRKCKGLLGVATTPDIAHFRLVLVLPV